MTDKDADNQNEIAETESQSMSENNVEDKLLSLVHAFLVKLERHRSAMAVTLHAQLDKDLGIDSIGKVELFHEVEDAFNIHLPDSVLGSALTVNDIAKAIKTAHPQVQVESKIITPSKLFKPFKPSEAQSLVEILLNWTKKDPNRPHIYFQDETGKEKVITFKMLLDNAQRVANGLYAVGIRPNDCVSLMLPTNEKFFYCFMGILLIGAVPVPIYPPFRVDKIEEYALREEKILKQAEVKALITFERAEKLSGLLSAFIHTLKTVTTFDQLVKQSKRAPIAKVQSQHPALIQFTSGSTSIPKGVLLSQNNILENLKAAGDAIEVVPSDVVVSWLPLYHDMGLIGCWFGSLYYACPLVVMSPLTFLSRPERWLWAIHYHRGTISASPNFGYELCIKRIKEKDIEGLDLSSWRLALNGAEAVNPNTVEAFIKKFEPYGFKAETMFPVYGLAENAVALCFPPINRKPVIEKVDLEEYEKNAVAKPITDEQQKHLKFVGCGRAVPRHAVRVVDQDDKVVADRIIGTIQFKGPSRMQGYYNNKEATELTIRDGWCDTGDFGYIADGEIFITGRKKDIIIKAGRNIFPEVIEDVTSHVSGIRRGCVVAFGTMDNKLGTEKLVIIAESRETDKQITNKMKKQISERVTVALGVPPDEIQIVKPATIPKTSSGKLQRAQCKKLYQDGKLSAWRPPVWMQVAKIAAKGAFSKWLGWLGLGLQAIFTCYVWIGIILILIPNILGLYLLPAKGSRALAKLSCRLILMLAFIRIQLDDPNKLLSKSEPCVLVANHASYVDACIMYAFLPLHFSFIVKKGLYKVPMLKRALKKHGHFGVDREDFHQNIEDTQKILSSMKKGRSLGVFPEGAFTAKNGLRAFKTGAFKCAVEFNMPVLPVALNRTRVILRSGEWLLKPKRVKVSVGKLIYPTENSWEEIMRLHSESRHFIEKHCGEYSIET